MKPAKDWSFPFLLGLRPWHLNLPACDTLAYWPLLVDAKQAAAIDAEDWVSKMAYQFDCEEQATEADDFLSDPDTMPTTAHPVAPVCLSRLWSPFPIACADLGTPHHAQVSLRGAAVAIWTSVDVEVPVDKSPADVAFYQSLMAQAVKAAKESREAVCLVAKIGWSYDESAPFSRSQRNLMKKAGFLEDRRRP